MATQQDLLVVNEFHPETLEKLSTLYQTHHLWHCATREDKAELIQALNGHCRAAASGSWDCDPLVYELGSLELIAAFGVGVDGIDLKRAGNQGIRVTNTPNVLNNAVADVAIALVLATMRNIVSADRYVRNGNWVRANFPAARDLAGKTLGIIGLGRIGEAIVHRALPFKLKIAYHNRSPKKLPYTYYPTITELASNCDILLSVLPGGDDSQHAVDASVFERLGPNGIFINVGRGSAVDEKALVHALQTGRIAAAGLDVYEHEPHVPQVLFQMENVVLLPHIGSGTLETRRAMGDLLIGNLQAFFAGEPLPTEVV